MSDAFKNDLSNKLIDIYETHKHSEKQGMTLFEAACQIQRWERIIRYLQRGERPGWREEPITLLHVNIPVIEVLSRHGIETLGDLARHSPEDLLSLRGIGATTLDRIRFDLLKRGAWLSGDDLAGPD